MRAVFCYLVGVWKDSFILGEASRSLVVESAQAVTATLKMKLPGEGSDSDHR